jgi:hypothetical protein
MFGQFESQDVPTFSTSSAHSNAFAPLGGQFFNTAQYAPDWCNADMHKPKRSGGHRGALLSLASRGSRYVNSRPSVTGEGDGSSELIVFDVSDI